MAFSDQSKAVLTEAFERIEASERSLGQLGIGEAETGALVNLCIELAGVDEEWLIRKRLYKKGCERGAGVYGGAVEHFYNGSCWHFFMYERTQEMLNQGGWEEGAKPGFQMRLRKGEGPTFNSPNSVVFSQETSYEAFDLAWKVMVESRYCATCENLLWEPMEVCQECLTYYQSSPCRICLKRVGKMTDGEHPVCKKRRKM